MSKDSGAIIILVYLAYSKQPRWVVWIKNKMAPAMIGIGGTIRLLVELKEIVSGWKQIQYSRGIITHAGNSEDF